jgi:uncharacterized cupredoxin-like copper-binding protein
MSTKIKRESESAGADLAEELHELEAQEAELERRTRSLELAGPIAVVFSVFALALSVGALVVGLGRDGDHSATNGNMMRSTAPASGMMAGAGGHGEFTASMMAAATKRTVYVQLGDYWAAPAVSSVPAGKVTFIARNVGKVPHEFMVESMPMRFDAPMRPDEDAAQGMIEDMNAGQSGRLTTKLRPGTYMLFCNLPGHYSAGQHIRFKVTPS